MLLLLKKYVTNIRRHRATYINDIRYTVANITKSVPELLRRSTGKYWQAKLLSPSSESFDSVIASTIKTKAYT